MLYDKILRYVDIILFVSLVSTNKVVFLTTQI